MQFRITFQVLQPGQLMPLSYQYELSSWIYSRIHQSDSEFANFLHGQGYGLDNKRFKLFTFSNLWVPPRYEIIDDRMKVWSREISFVVSFLVPRAAAELITGLFKEHRFALGDKISRLDLKTQTIEVLQPLEERSGTLQLRATSPILLSKAHRNTQGKLQHDYLAPSAPDYAERFLNNLLKKHQSALAHGLAAPLPEVYETHFKCLSPKPKSSLIRIKADGDNSICGEGWKALDGEFPLGS